MSTATAIKMPDYFLSEASDITKADILGLDRYDLTGMAATGSRAICPSVARLTSDWDIVALATPEAVHAMAEDGWEFAGSMEGTNEMAGRRQFASLRNRSVNVLACLDKEFFDRYLLATELCMSLAGPADRAGRIKVFRAILYSESPES